ncbi:hypothetical protein AB0J72_54215 [Dactylosporangium sp. NPDC049742]|uniref:hypothetical protein n=1 Tax=Dactylosporangium sp. NPDC049742 TaxID=3154737 RepID=UPI003446F4A0
MSIDGGRRWAVVAAAGAGTLVALVAAVLVVNRQSAAPGEQQQPPPSVRAAADPRTLVVDDGDLVEASGQVLVAPGKPARLCAPAPVPAIGRAGNEPPSCALGVDVTGVDPAKLTGASVVAGVTTGQARLRGTWRDGRLHVTEQGPPKPPAPVGFDDTVPCAAPKGGWKPGGGADSNAMHQYIYEQHPDRFRPLRIAYPDGPPTGATTGPQPTEVTVVEVVAGDAAGEEQRLRKLFDGNLCVVAAPGRPSIARQEQLREQVSAGLDPLMSDPVSGIWSVGGDDVFTVELMMLTPRLYEQLNAIGFDLLRVEPWLRPTVG